MSNDIRELLPEYIKGQLSTDETIEIEQALQDDVQLHKEYEGLVGYFDAIGALPSVQASDDFLEKVHASIEKQSMLQRIISWFCTFSGRKFSLEAIGVVAVLLVIVVLYRPIFIREFGQDTTASNNTARTEYRGEYSENPTEEAEEKAMDKEADRSINPPLPPKVSSGKKTDKEVSSTNFFTPGEESRKDAVRKETSSNVPKQNVHASSLPKKAVPSPVSKPKKPSETVALGKRHQIKELEDTPMDQEADRLIGGYVLKPKRKESPSISQNESSMGRMAYDEIAEDSPEPVSSLVVRWRIDESRKGGYVSEPLGKSQPEFGATKKIPFAANIKSDADGEKNDRQKPQSRSDEGFFARENDAATINDVRGQAAKEKATRGSIEVEEEVASESEPAGRNKTGEQIKTELADKDTISQQAPFNASACLLRIIDEFNGKTISIGTLSATGTRSYDVTLPREKVLGFLDRLENVGTIDANREIGETAVSQSADGMVHLRIVIVDYSVYKDSFR